MATVKLSTAPATLAECLEQLEAARLCLAGIASCSTCEVCRGAAESALGRLFVSLPQEPPPGP